MICKSCGTRKGAANVAAKLAFERIDCRNCGKVFSPRQPVQVFCSHSCNNRYWCNRKREIRRGVYVEPVDLDKIYKRDGGICQICRKRVNLKSKKPKDQPSLDHIIPAIDGGKWEYKNVQLAHRGCNSRKQRRRGMGQTRIFG